MDITKCAVYGGVNVGLYVTVGDTFLLVPSGMEPAKADILSKLLGAPWHHISISGTRLLGAMCAHNGVSMILPKTLFQSEYDILQDILPDNIHVLDARYTALGNLICANRRGAIVSPLFSGPERGAIQDALDVETVSMHVAGMVQSGSVATTNDTGTVVHPMADEDEQGDIADILGTRVEPSTINNGVPYVSSGLLVNNTSIVIGDMTTGPEIMMLTRAFLG